jgi:hypothetical protein
MQSPSASLDRGFAFALTCVGVNHHPCTVPCDVGCKVLLKRDHHNVVDDKAVAVFLLADDSDLPAPAFQIGHLAWYHARELAPVLDSGLATVTAASIDGRRPSHGELIYEYSVAIELIAKGEAADALDVSDVLHGRKLVQVSEISKEIASQDASRAEGYTSCAKWPLSADSGCPWQPAASWPMTPPTTRAAAARAPSATKVEPPVDAKYEDDSPYEVSGSHPPGYQFRWAPFALDAIAPLDPAEVQQAQAAGWPPPDATLLKLGLGMASDGEWWEAHGLKPPSEWDLHGALDLLPGVRGQSQANIKRAKQALGGGAHSCLPWLDETLDAIHALMHEPDFWCKRKPDAFIRGFGGPYVLGQDEGKLHLIHGAPHTPLTELVSRGHTLIYLACHLHLPPAPGFNTLIFGLNNRAAGFAFHHDAEIPGLKAKNAPLVPYQPVVTTIVYERPGVDSSKEMVVWKPSQNWDWDPNPLSGSARAIVTPHGCAHIQRAGLQRATKHGVFHNPFTPAREGWRVALTARVAKVDAAELLDEHIVTGAYVEQLGPDGQWRLPKPSSIEDA